jgi:hypothetical protein
MTRKRQDCGTKGCYSRLYPLFIAKWIDGKSKTERIGKYWCPRCQKIVEPAENKWAFLQ